MADSYIYTGVWLNWAKGPILGATLTTSHSNGLYLVSFLTMFVRMAGGHLWSIICFALHQLRSSREPQDGLYHQQQMLLRNSTSDTATLWELVKQTWFWRSKAKRGIWRTIPLIAIGLMHLVLFAAAAIFVSRISNTSDEVLIMSPHCGYPLFPAVNSANDVAGLVDTFIDGRTMATWAENYVQACYNTTRADGSCNTFATPRLLPAISYTAGCPFADEMCLDPAAGTISIDSGLIDSDLDLGINSRPEHRVGYRRVTQCAPLVTEGVTEWQDGGPNAIPGNQYLNFYYGPSLVNGSLSANATFSYNKYFANETDRTYSLEYVYLVYKFLGNPLTESIISSFVTSYVGNLEDSTFVPNLKLNRTDADVTLVALLNFAQYPQPVEDLWYNATILTVNTEGTYHYAAQKPVSIMGCTEQHQFCQPNDLTQCTPLGSSLTPPPLDSFPMEQVAIAEHMHMAIVLNTLNTMIYYLGASSLQASLAQAGEDTMGSGLLPPDQWRTDVTFWHYYIMARMQRLIVEYAAGPENPSFNKYFQAPALLDAFNVCRNQKIRNSQYYSFSLLGLIITVTVGTAIVLTNLLLTPIVSLIQKLTGRGLSRREDWEQDHMLHVQRMAYENAGIGSWSNKDGLVPVTAKGQRFGKPTMGTDMEGEGGGGRGHLVSPYHMPEQNAPFLYKAYKEPTTVDVRENTMSP